MNSIRLFHLTIILSCILLGREVKSQVPFKKVEPTRYLSFVVPSGFVELTADQRLETFPSSKVPMAAYTDRSRLGVFGVNKTTTRWNESDLELLRGFYESNIRSLHDSVRFINKGIREVNSRQFAYFEFTSFISGDEESIRYSSDVAKYNFIQYTIVSNHIFVFNFMSDARHKSNFSQNIDRVMKSIKFKKKIK